MRGISAWVINEMRPSQQYQGTLIYASEQPGVVVLKAAGPSNISSFVSFNEEFLTDVLGVSLEEPSSGLTILADVPTVVQSQMRSINNAVHDGARSISNSVVRTAGLFSYAQLPNAIVDIEEIVRIYRTEIQFPVDRLADSFIDFQLLMAGEQALLLSGNLHPDDESRVIRHIFAEEGTRISVGDPILEYQPLFTYRTTLGIDDIPVDVANAAPGAIIVSTLSCVGPVEVAEAQENQWQQPLPHSDLNDRTFSIDKLKLPVLITVDRLAQSGLLNGTIGDPSTVSLILHIQYEDRFFNDGPRRLRVVDSLAKDELACSLSFS